MASGQWSSPGDGESCLPLPSACLAKMPRVGTNAALLGLRVALRAKSASCSEPNIMRIEENLSRGVWWVMIAGTSGSPGSYNLLLAVD